MSNIWLFTLFSHTHTQHIRICIDRVVCCWNSLLWVWFKSSWLLCACVFSYIIMLQKLCRVCVTVYKIYCIEYKIRSFSPIFEEAALSLELTMHNTECVSEPKIWQCMFKFGKTLFQILEINGRNFCIEHGHEQQKQYRKWRKLSAKNFRSLFWIC